MLQSMAVRNALLSDDAHLVRIDERSWRWFVGPTAPRGDRFFASTRPDDVLVAEVDHIPVGYVRLGRRTELPSNSHVLQIHGLAVDPDFRRAGIGQTLVEHAIAEAQRRGASKIWLCVFEPNAAARALYLRCGFGVVGILRDEFRVEEHSVDDVLMELHL